MKIGKKVYQPRVRVLLLSMLGVVSGRERGRKTAKQWKQIKGTSIKMEINRYSNVGWARCSAYWEPGPNFLLPHPHTKQSVIYRETTSSWGYEIGNSLLWMYNYIARGEGYARIPRRSGGVWFLSCSVKSERWQIYFISIFLISLRWAPHNFEVVNCTEIVGIFITV